MDKWDIRYIVGVYNDKNNTCCYLNNTGFFNTYFDATTFTSDIANSIVETNTFRNNKLVYKKDSKFKHLFVSKIFYHNNTGIIKLTKQNAFQLMEVVVNNI